MMHNSNISEKFADCTFLSDVNANYCLYIGMSTQTDHQTDVYKVVNKDTGVIEAELSMLPRAYEYCEMLNDQLTAIEHAFAADEPIGLLDEDDYELDGTKH